MKYDEFIKQVQTIGKLDSRDKAEQATRATLEAIRERIVGDEAKDLASQLPKELAEYLHGREGENGQHFGIEEFLKMVSQKQGVEVNEAKMHARAVFQVLEDAVSPGEFADVRINFSDDYQELFSGSVSESIVQ